MTVKNARAHFTTILKDAQISSAMLDVDVLLGNILKKGAEYFWAHPEVKLTSSQLRRMTNLVERRTKHEPIAYLLGFKEFLGYQFKVNRQVLIPRAETEALVTKSLEIIARHPNQKLRIADIGTGSGAIIISLAKEIIKIGWPIKKYQLWAADLSTKALKIAQKNADALNVLPNIKFTRGDLLKPLKGPFDLILANLPYLSFTEYYNSPHLEALKFEPRLALTDEKDGLENFRKFFRQAPKTLKKGFIILEIGFDQSSEIKKISSEAFPKADFQMFKDFCGFDRIVVITVN